MNIRENDLYSPIEQVSGQSQKRFQYPGENAAQAHPHGADGRGSGGYCQESALSASLKRILRQLPRIIQNRSDMIIKSEKNYLKHVKQSGYRSLSSDHLLHSRDISTAPGSCRQRFRSVQWPWISGQLYEHSLQYKYKGDMPPHVAERLTNAV